MSSLHSIKGIWLIAGETFTLLRRDRIFVPTLVGACLVTGFALLASQWTIDEDAKVLADVGFFGLNLIGTLATFIWGTKTMSDTRQEGSLEVQLASPLPRAAWLVGKYLGLAVCLALLAVGMLAIWQLGRLIGAYGMMTDAEVSAFAYMVLGWEVIAALALTLASVSGYAVALFSTIALWLAGLGSALVANTLAPNSPPAMRAVVQVLARFWDLQQFNLIDHARDPHILPAAELGWRAGYGLVLIIALLSMACIAFSRRDSLTAA